MGGGAQNGVDYTPGLNSIVTIPAGQGAITNWITPVTDALVEGVESVSATVNPGNDYVVDTEATATMTTNTKTARFTNRGSSVFMFLC
jgi:hypothetical protein